MLHEPKLPGLPYWDSSMDSALPVPRHSVVWDTFFFGSPQLRANKLNLNNTLFVDLGSQYNATSTVYLKRELGADPDGKLMTQSDVDHVLSRTSFKQLTACVDLKLERASRQLYQYIGGSMQSGTWAPLDLVFWMHHAHLDYLWDTWTRTPDINTYYTPDYEACSRAHYAKSTMIPFGQPDFNSTVTNIHAYSNPEIYEYFYAYEATPSCADACGGPSSHYFCHSRLDKCLSRISYNGNCTGMEAYPSCVGFATCLGGQCVMPWVNDRNTNSLVNDQTVTNLTSINSTQLISNNSTNSTQVISPNFTITDLPIRKTEDSLTDLLTK